MKKKLMLCVAIALSASSAVYSAGLSNLISNAGLQELKPSPKIIDFRLDNLDGKSVSLSSYTGKVVLLNFWATWCGPCRSEMGSMEALYNKFKDKGFVILAVNLQQGPSEVKQFVEEHNLTFPVLLDRSGRVGMTYGARGIPTTYLINRQGEITSGTQGAREWTTPQLYSLVQALLAQQ